MLNNLSMCNLQAAAAATPKQWTELVSAYYKGE